MRRAPFALLVAGLSIPVLAGAEGGWIDSIGRAFDETRARRFAGAGLASLGVSVDGDEPTHDLIRNNAGSFAAAMRALDAGRAANLLLTARTIEASEAHRIGLFHEIVSSDLVWARAQEIAGEIAKSAPESLQLTKRLLNETLGENLTTQLTAGAIMSATARTTEAAAEGLAAFLEKREPKWP